MKTESIVLGGGCFWCLDASFRLINGITGVVSGYSGGSGADANYNAVCTGETSHAEVVEVTFDKKGPQYRSVIFYNSDSQKNTAKTSIDTVRKLWDNPVVTELLPLEHFYPAEAYHQNYFENNPGNGYCNVIINPKLTKLRQQFAERVKS